MAQYWVKVARVYEDYVEADSEDEAIEMAQETVIEGYFGYWDNDVGKCEDEEGENE